MASHFSDHNMDESDIRDLLKKIKANVQNARTRFARTIPAVRGAMLETDNPVIYEQYEKILAHLCFIVDVIDGKVLPSTSDFSDEIEALRKEQETTDG